MPLYVKLPSAAGDALHRAAQARGVPKKELVAELVTRYIDVDAPRAAAIKRVEPVGERGPMMGVYSFQATTPPDLPEVLNAAQAGELLQISEHTVIELAEAGRLPGKKLGPVWRFSRTGLVAWLETPDTQHKEHRK